MAGLWNKSRVVEIDQNGNIIPGALASFYEANTDEAMTVYSDVTLGEINEHSNPVVADGNGRWPLVFFDDVTDIDPVTPGVQSRQYYRVRVTDAGGVLLYDDRSVPIIGQSEGGGGGVPPPPVDQTALSRTGDVKIALDNSTQGGWVRMNGRTIGKGTSGATERPNDDTQALYSHLWGKTNQTICEVIGGRGANALADFTANKPLTLPDMRGRAPFGIDNMNNAPSGRIAAAYMDVETNNTLGAWGGDDEIVLVANNLAAHQHPGAGGNDGATPPVAAPLVAAAHTHMMVDDYNGGTENDPLTAAKPIAERGFISDGGPYKLAGGPAAANIGKTGPAVTVPPVTTGPLAGTLVVTGNTGSNVTTGTAHENMPPFMLFTFYIKL